MAEGKEKKGKGRPTKYKEEYNEQAYKLCLLGHTHPELAKFFEVDVDTIHEWQNVYPQFSEAVKKGKELADSEIVNSFYNRAKGFEIESEKIFCSEGTIVRAQTKTYFPPDAGAAMNWLKNRQPDKWRDKKDVSLEGTIKLGKATEDEIFE